MYMYVYESMKRKTTIPKALREQVWLSNFGPTFETKCYVHWCSNIINVFDFHCGHDKPESVGGLLEITNLKPICARCNLSMNNNYTIQEWSNLSIDKKQKENQKKKENKKKKRCWCF